MMIDHLRIGLAKLGLPLVGQLLKFNNNKKDSCIVGSNFFYKLLLYYDSVLFMTSCISIIINATTWNDREYHTIYNIHVIAMLLSPNLKKPDLVQIRNVEVIMIKFSGADN